MRKIFLTIISFFMLCCTKPKEQPVAVIMTNKEDSNTPALELIAESDTAQENAAPNIDAQKPENTIENAISETQAVKYGEKNIWDEDIFKNIYDKPEYYKDNSEFQYKEIISEKSPYDKGDPGGNKIFAANDEITLAFWSWDTEKYKLEEVMFTQKSDKYFLSTYIGEKSNIVYQTYAMPAEYRIKRKGENHIIYETDDHSQTINFTLMDDVVEEVFWGYNP